MALGVFDAAGVVRLRPHREADVATVSDLLVYSLEELEAVAEATGGIRRLLDEKWVKVYKARSPRGLLPGQPRRRWRASEHDGSRPRGVGRRSAACKRRRAPAPLHGQARHLSGPPPIWRYRPGMVKIRLMRMGAKGAPSYRVVVSDARAPRADNCP
jgi:hypothetical protein